VPRTHDLARCREAASTAEESTPPLEIPDRLIASLARHPFARDANRRVSST
jgi:hypothetical protein